MLISIVLGALLLAVSVALVAVAMRARRERVRFAAIVDVEKEVARLRETAAADVESARVKARDELAQLRAAATTEAEAMRKGALDDIARTRAEAERMLDTASRAKQSAEADAARLRLDVNAEADAVRRSVAEDRAQHRRMQTEIAEARGTLMKLSDEVRQVEGNLEDISFGLYRPQYSFDTPEQFKAEMERVFDKQKQMIRDGKAASCAVEWHVGGSRKEGERMQKQYSKLLLRAFNGESDSAIAKVTWNNATKMEERIRKAFDAINQLGGVMQVVLSPGYRDLKLMELRLEYELAERKREIAEEQRRIREQMKDEQKALQEAERAQAEAEADEARFEKALQKATLELAKSRGEEHQRLSLRIEDLQKQLIEAQSKSIRAKSLAEMTRAGWVYVISNIGSFGENVFKIGLTRRMEPMDRVRELGDASVPFPFDVHAMVYSDDAPALESAFHQRFRDRNLNMVNLRKEFFRVELAELEGFAKEKGLAMTFTKLAEARQYRESVAMRLAKGSGPTAVPVRPSDELAVGSALSKHTSASPSA